MALKYIGEHGAALDGIPARDLSDDEVRAFGEAALLRSGLYARADGKSQMTDERKAARARETIVHKEGE